MMTSSDSSQFALCKYVALRELIFTTERKQLAQGILGKVTLTSIVEDFRKANPLAARDGVGVAGQGISGHAEDAVGGAVRGAGK